MDNSQSASYNAGQTKGHVEEKSSQMAGKAQNAAHSAMESTQEAAGQAQAKAHDAMDSVKNAMSSNK